MNKQSALAVLRLSAPLPLLSEESGMADDATQMATCILTAQHATGIAMTSTAIAKTMTMR